MQFPSLPAIEWSFRPGQQQGQQKQVKNPRKRFSQSSFDDESNECSQDHRDVMLVEAQLDSGHHDHCKLENPDLSLLMHPSADLTKLQSKLSDLRVALQVAEQSGTSLRQQVRRLIKPCTQALVLDPSL
jgi:hypothetical protein